MSQLTRQTGSGVLWNGSVVGIQTLLNVLSLAILARLLSPSDYGVIGAAQVFIQFGMTFAALGLGPTLIQSREITSSMVGTAFFLSLASGGMLAALMWLGSPVIAQIMHIPDLENVCRVLSLALIFQSVTIIANSVMARYLRFRLIAMLGLVSWSLSIFAIAIPCAFFQMGYWSLVAGRLAEIIIYAGTVTWFARSHFTYPQFDIEAFRKIRRTASGYALSALSTFIAGNVDNAFVARYIGQAQLGIYSRSYLLISLPASLFGRIAEVVVFPAMSRLQDDEKRFASGYLKGIQLTAISTMPASAFLVLFAPEIVSVLLGRAWEDAVLPIQLFASGIYFRVGYKTYSLSLLARGRSHTVSVIQMLYAGIVALTTYVGAQYGLVYICIGVVAALSANCLMFAVMGIREAKIDFADIAQAHVPAVFSTLLILVTGLAVLQYTPACSNTVRLELGVLACAAVCLSVLRISPRLVLGGHGLEVARNMVGHRIRWL